MTSPTDAPDPAAEPDLLGHERLAARIATLPRWAAWIPAGLALVVFAFSLGWVLHERTTTPGAGSVDVGFLQDMTAHHDQAVEMALVVFGADSGASTVVRQLASEVLLSQRWENGRMFGWLSQWGHDADDPDRVPMRWMKGAAAGDHHDMSGHDMSASMTVATMPGMQSAEAMAQLRAAKGKDLDRLFLTMMRAHHEGGIPMAEYAAQHAGQGAVRTFAGRMAEAQRGEVNDYTAWLGRLGLA